MAQRMMERITFRPIPDLAALASACSHRSFLPESQKWNLS